jgi:hypothetical protein
MISARGKSQHLAGRSQIKPVSFRCRVERCPSPHSAVLSLFARLSSSFGQTIGLVPNTPDGTDHCRQEIKALIYLSKTVPILLLFQVNRSDESSCADQPLNG